MVKMIMLIGHVVFGLIAIVFSKAFAKVTSDFYYKLSSVRFSEKGYQVAFVICGIGFAIIGILAIFGIIKYKWLMYQIFIIDKVENKKKEKKVVNL